MKTFRKIARLAGLVVLLLLASMGVALVPIFPRDEPMKKEATTEWVEKHKEDDEELL